MQLHKACLRSPPVLHVRFGAFHSPHRPLQLPRHANWTVDGKSLAPRPLFPSQSSRLTGSRVDKPPQAFDTQLPRILSCHDTAQRPNQTSVGIPIPSPDLTTEMAQPAHPSFLTPAAVSPDAASHDGAASDFNTSWAWEASHASVTERARPTSETLIRLGWAGLGEDSQNQLNQR